MGNIDPNSCVMEFLHRDNLEEDIEACFISMIVDVTKDADKWACNERTAQRKWKKKDS